MSKGNLFFGQAKGSIGDVVLYHAQGQQIARSRNRNPKNPRSGLQLAQRVIMKTTSLAYSLMRRIADHSFQGLQEGTPNQSRFTQRNVYLMREQIESILASGDASDVLTSSLTNFASKYLTQPVARPYLVAEGSLPTLPVSIVNGIPQIADAVIAEGEVVHYDDFIADVGLEKGDQLTFLFFYSDDTDVTKSGTFTGMDVARVILEPADGDYDNELANDGDFEKPESENPRNEGSVYLKTVTGAVQFLPATARTSVQGGLTRSLSGVAVIVSRYEDGAWRRSNASIVLMPKSTSATTGLLNEYEKYTLGDAAASYLTGADSSLYLNQAT